jgi:hypothetical protein
MINKLKQIALNLRYYLILGFVILPAQVYAQPSIQIQQGAGGLGFTIPTLGEVLTFAIRIFFIIAGLAALLYLLLGALAWVTSGGDKGNVEKARDKIQAAIIGVILVVVVLAIIVTLEQVIFNSKVCFGISCAITIPPLVK